MSQQETSVQLILNASRIGKVGGLRSFAESLIRCFEGCPGVITQAPSGLNLSTDIPQRSVPGWLASSGRISVLKPVLWWLYSAVSVMDIQKAKILCTTHHVVPFRRQQIVTVHDLRPYYFPDTWVQSVYFRFLLPRALRKCDGILTVSETTKKLLVGVYGVDSTRIRVLYNIVDSEFFCPDPNIKVARSYLLSVGASWQHKNIAELLKMHVYWDGRYDLKIVASKGQYLDQLQELAKKLNLSGHIEFLTGISKETLRSLYRGCAALVYPSLMEGFGLPPLEAMSCGRPVVVSDSPLFRELFKDIPIYVTLGDAQSWKNSFAALESFSKDTLKAGVRLARTFSQARMRESLLRSLEYFWQLPSLEAIIHSKI